jgi:hypothetical protein
VTEFTPEQIRTLNKDVRKNEAARRRKARRLAGLAALDPDEPRYRPKPVNAPVPQPEPACWAEDHEGRHGCSNPRCGRWVCAACRPIQAETRCTSCHSRKKADRMLGLDCHCKRCGGRGLTDKQADVMSRRPIPAHERCDACQAGDHEHCTWRGSGNETTYCGCRGECRNQALTPSA